MPAFARLLLPYLVTIANVAVIAGIKFVLRFSLEVEAPLALFYTPVIGSAWFGGRRQGFFATVLVLITSYILFVYPHSFWATPETYGWRFILFGFDCVLVTFACGAMRAAQSRAELALAAFRSAQSLSRDSQARFNHVYESNMIGLMTTKSDGTILDCNDYVLDLLGYTRQDMLDGQLNWKKLSAPEHLARGDKTSMLLQTSDVVKPYEKEYIRKDGSRVQVLVGAARLADGVAVVFVLDIQERKRSEQALEMRVSERTAELRLIAERLQQSQQFLDSVIENLPAMVFVKDAATLRFVRFNRAGEKLLGYSREELLGKNDYDLFSKEQADVFVARDRAVLEGCEVVDIPEEPIVTKQGMRFLHTKKIPIVDVNGKPIYLLGISEDISEMKNAELQRLTLIQEQTARAEAEKSAEQLRFLTDASAALNESLDLKLRLDAFARTVTANLGDWCEIVLVNEADRQLEDIVVSHRDPTKRALARAFRAEHRLNWDSPIGAAQAIISGEPQLYSLLTPEVLQPTDDQRKNLMHTLGIHSTIIVPLQSFGRSIGAMTIANAETRRSYTQRDLSLGMDLAKRASFAVENSRLYRQAQEASQAKSAFLANMSHEIRTPLGAMLGFAELLGDDSLSNSQKQYLQTLLRNGQQLLRIVDEILDLSKVESDRIQIENVSVDPNELLDEVISLLRLQAQAKQIALNVKMPRALPAKIVTDPTRLRQILLNVIGNAIKFTLQGEVNISVGLHERPNLPGKPVLEITVDDTGIGISKDQRDRLFQAFVQADNSTTRKFGGTGLGLFLSRRLARLMGGDVVLAESHPEHGSRFVITTTIQVEENNRLPTANAQPTQDKTAPKKGRVLVVDDAADNRVLIELYITRLGYSTDVAGGGAEALELALTNEYDLIFMDVQMPGMDGFEAISRLRAQNYSGPIVALTAHTMKGDRERCLAGGFDGYLGKPINREQLRGYLEQYVQRTPSTGASSDSLTHL